MICNVYLSVFTTAVSHTQIRCVVLLYISPRMILSFPITIQCDDETQGINLHKESTLCKLTIHGHYRETHYNKLYVTVISAYNDSLLLIHTTYTICATCIHTHIYYPHSQSLPLIIVCDIIQGIIRLVNVYTQSYLYIRAEGGGSRSITSQSTD